MSVQLITEPPLAGLPPGAQADVSESVLHQLMNASSAMRRSDDPDRILDILVSSVLLIVPATAVCAAWKSAGAPLDHAIVFDPLSPSAAVPSIGHAELEAALEAWAPRLSAGASPFEDALGWSGQLTARVTVFPMSSSSRVGALVVRESSARLSHDLAAIGMLCDRALSALELVSARASGQRAAALSETLTQLAASYSKPELVLQAVVRSAARLLQADAAYVMLVDDAGTTLRVRTAHGITSGAFYESSCPVDQLFPGAAIRKRRVVCVRDVQSHREAEQSRSEGLRTTLCAPMFVEDELVGVLVAAHRTIRELSVEDRRTLAALADAAAISITNARLYGEREDSIRDLASVNRLLEQRSAAAERTVAFQQRLTALILEAGGLERIVEAMTERLGCQVVILDRELAVLHASDGAALDPERLGDAIAQLEEAAEIAQFEVDGKRLLVAPLDLAGARTAYVVVISEETILTGPELGMTEAAVTAIGLELMRDRAETEAEARLTGGLFGALLSDDEIDEARILRRASYLGYELAGANVVIAVSAAQDGCNGRRPLSLETCVQRAIRRRREGPVAVFERDEAIFVVLSDPEHVATETIRDYTAAIKQELDVSGRSAGIRIAHAGPHLGIAGVRRAVSEAKYAVHVLGMLGMGGKPHAFNDLGVWTLLGRVGDREQLMSFAGGVLGVLMAHDAERQSQLVDTVRTLVECNFHYRTAAEQLYTHPNTLRYRMSRINELTGLDFTDADHRLKVELALRILDVMGPTSP